MRFDLVASTPTIGWIWDTADWGGVYIDNNYDGTLCGAPLDVIVPSHNRFFVDKETYLMDGQLYVNDYYKTCTEPIEVYTDIFDTRSILYWVQNSVMQLIHYIIGYFAITATAAFPSLTHLFVFVASTLVNLAFEIAGLMALQFPWLTINLMISFGLTVIAGKFYLGDWILGIVLFLILKLVAYILCEISRKGYQRL
jgi:hypothetical protein